MVEPKNASIFDFLTWFRLQLFDEVRQAVELYGEAGEQLAGYYAPDIERYEQNPRREMNRFTRTREYFPARRIYGRSNVRVLDCGTGLGTEDLLFALLGAEVVGVDLRTPRLELAEKRVARWSKELGRQLPIELHLENLFDLEFDNRFDLIWVKEAISHIHPLPEFYAWALKSLKPGGQLMVTDPNAEKTSTRESIDAEREGELIKTWPHPRTGEPIPYADERILTVPQLMAGMQAAGFDAGEVEVFVPGQSTPPRWLWRMIFRPLNHFLPLSRRIGGEFCAAGVKPG